MQSPSSLRVRQGKTLPAMQARRCRQAFSFEGEIKKTRRVSGGYRNLASLSLLLAAREIDDGPAVESIHPSPLDC